jgi:hypothetical protein
VFEPQDEKEDAGAHGGFDDQAHVSDPQLWLSMHRRAAAAGLGAAAVLAGSVLARRRSR